MTPQPDPTRHLVPPERKRLIVDCTNHLRWRHKQTVADQDEINEAVLNVDERVGVNMSAALCHLTDMIVFTLSRLPEPMRPKTLRDLVAQIDHAMNQRDEILAHAASWAAKFAAERERSR